MAAKEMTSSRDGEDRGPNLRIYIIIMLLLSLLAISLRLWSRSLSHKHMNHTVRFWWDDWAAVATMPFLLAQSGIIFYMLDSGLGRHIGTLSDDMIAANLVAIYAVYFVYDIALFITKTSALLFFSRIFTKYTTKTWFNYALWVTHGLNVSWLLGIVFGTIFMCDPVAKGYIPDLDGHCGQTSALWIGSAVPSVIIDLTILLLPLPKIWGLQLSRGKRAGISFAFILGYCVIVVSIGRLTDEGVPALYWLCAESPITLVSICLPAMLPLGRHLVNNYISPVWSKASSLISSQNSRDRDRMDFVSVCETGGTKEQP
ncbi:hypothetical protein PG985_003027 [Apiospora marii]|uniref:uncharacterized protein n=1 Tax=Apiospora marii TaxID=335849 RepID=UPI00312E1C0F